MDNTKILDEHDLLSLKSSLKSKVKEEDMICSVCVKAKSVPQSDAILEEKVYNAMPSTSEASFDLKPEEPIQKKTKLDLPRAMSSSRNVLYVAHIEKIIQPLPLKLYCLSIGQIYL